MKKFITALLAAVVTMAASGCNASAARRYVMPQSGSDGARTSVHDPSVFRDKDGVFYAFGSHYAVASSKDLLCWTQLASDGDYGVLYGKNCAEAVGFPGFPEVLRETLALVYPQSSITTTWAPDVEYYDGTYYMYYSLTGYFGSRQSAIGRVEAKSVLGPYENNEIIVDSMGGTGDAPNCIDPELFYDKKGGLWMVYGSFAGGIYVKELWNKGNNWGLPKESGYGKRVWANEEKGVEGPFIFYHEDTGYYYLITSHGGLGSDYNMRVARSKYPDGPYVDVSGADVATSGGGYKLAGNYVLGEDGYAAIGHNSVVKTSDDLGDRYFVVAHARRKEGDAGVTAEHQLSVFQLYFTEDGWPVMNPNCYAGEATGRGIERETLVGEYDLLLHTKETTAEFTKSEKCCFSADGTILKEGVDVGKWEYKDDCFVALTLGKTQYRGVVTPSWRMYAGAEKGPVFSMTAISDTMQTLWVVGRFAAQ